MTADGEFDAGLPFVIGVLPDDARKHEADPPVALPVQDSDRCPSAAILIDADVVSEGGRSAAIEADRDEALPVDLNIAHPERVRQANNASNPAVEKLGCDLRMALGSMVALLGVLLIAVRPELAITAILFRKRI